MFKTVCKCAHISTLWCFVYAKEEEGEFQSARTFDVKMNLKIQELQYYQ